MWFVKTIPKDTEFQISKLGWLGTGLFQWENRWSSCLRRIIVGPLWDKNFYEKGRLSKRYSLLFVYFITKLIQVILVTGGTFLIFDGALKQLDSRFSVSIVEDGFLVRLHNEVLEELVKSLAAGDDFNLKSSDFGEKAQELCIKFLSHEKFEGSILSPIDGLNLDGHYQYGLVGL